MHPRWQLYAVCIGVLVLLLFVALAAPSPVTG